MPRAREVPEITQEEVDDCWEIINSPKYAQIFDDEKIGA